MNPTPQTSPTSSSSDFPPGFRFSAREIFLDGARSAPTELLQFPFGPIRTLKGVFLFTPRSAKLVRAQWEALGREIGFDYEHDLWRRDLPSSEKVAPGWGRVEIRASGCWIVGIRWSDTATRQIVQREFRYLSQAFDADDKTGEILSLKNVALTNFPATLTPRPILLSTALSAPSPGMAETDPTHQKHIGVARMLAGRCGQLMSVAQDAAGSDHPALKAIGAGLAGAMPEHMSAIKASFPDMGEPDGDEGEMMSATIAEKDKEIEQLTAIVELAKQATGHTELSGLGGALLGLKAKADLQVTTARATDEQLRAAQVERMITAGQVHPSDRARFTALSAVDLAAFEKVAPRVGPKPPVDVQQVELNGQAPDAQAQELAAAEADALTILGIDPKAPWYAQKGQGLVRGHLPGKENA